MTPTARDYEPRKAPRQARSRRMRARILEAGVRVLSTEGALGFTTTRVAEEAGISVGSLYQYFPNKHAIVVALHRRDVEEGWEHLQQILDGDGGPRQKLDAFTRWFFETETEEVAGMGSVVGDVEVFLRDGADADLMAAAIERLVEFVRSGSTRDRSEAELRFAAHLLATSVEAIGKSVAARRLAAADVQRWAGATAAMLADHLELA